MAKMDFMNPHAILVAPNNFEEILSTIDITPTNLRELYAESIPQNIHSDGLGMRLYIVGWRNSVTGLPMWQTMTEVELACDYRLKTVNQFWHTFAPIKSED